MHLSFWWHSRSEPRHKANQHWWCSKGIIMGFICLCHIMSWNFVLIQTNGQTRCSLYIRLVKREAGWWWKMRMMSNQRKRLGWGCRRLNGLVSIMPGDLWNKGVCFISHNEIERPHLTGSDLSLFDALGITTMLLMLDLDNILRKGMKTVYLSAVLLLAQIFGHLLWMRALDLLLKFMSCQLIFFIKWVLMHNPLWGKFWCSICFFCD